MTLSRTYRPVTAEPNGTLVTSEVLPRIWATVVKLVPSVDTWISASLVSNDALSPPAPALRSVNDLMENDWPRSTCRVSGAAPEHHLSDRPPDTLPLNALSGVSVLAQAAEPVAGLDNATFVGPAPPLPYTSSS